MTRKLPSRSESSKRRSIHSSLPSAASCRISGRASGAMTRRRRPVLSRLPILSKAIVPAPTRRQRRPSSLRKIGRRLMVFSLIAHAVRHAAGGSVALDGGKNLAGQKGAQFVVRMAAEPGAQVLLRLAAGEIVAQQAFDRFRHQLGEAAITHRAGDRGVLAHRSPQAEVVGVGELALVLDLLPLDADVCNPMLAATVV